MCLFEATTLLETGADFVSYQHPTLLLLRSNVWGSRTRVPPGGRPPIVLSSFVQKHAAPNRTLSTPRSAILANLYRIHKSMRKAIKCPFPSHSDADPNVSGAPPTVRCCPRSVLSLHSSSATNDPWGSMSRSLGAKKYEKKNPFMHAIYTCRTMV